MGFTLRSVARRAARKVPSIGITSTAHVRLASLAALACALAAACAPAAPAASPVSRAEVPPPATTEAPAAVAPEPETGPELPRGGRKLFPDYQLVGFCGTPGASPALGRLDGNLAEKAKVIEGYAEKYSGSRKIMPVFELIAVVVQAAAGADNKYRLRVADSVVERYLKAARDAKALLLLNIQPGRSDFLSEVQHFEKYLGEPDVGIALDPEWAMKPGQTPGRVYGQTTGDTIDAVAEYLSGIVTRNHLPEKALVFHQVNAYVVKGEDHVKPYPGVAIINSVDGLGPMAMKLVTYNLLMGLKPQGVHPGFKLFFDEDTQNHGHLMTPKEVLALAPPPEYVMYE